MNENEQLDLDELLVGCTRPTMIMGVTFLGFVINVAVTGTSFIAANNIFLLAIFFPIHAVMALILKTEPRQFELIALWLKTKGKSVNKNHWGGRSSSPLGPHRTKLKNSQP